MFVCGMKSLGFFIFHYSNFLMSLLDERSSRALLNQILCRHGPLNITLNMFMFYIFLCSNIVFCRTHNFTFFIVFKMNKKKLPWIHTREERKKQRIIFQWVEENWQQQEQNVEGEPKNKKNTHIYNKSNGNSFFFRWQMEWD